MRIVQTTRRRLQKPRAGLISALSLMNAGNHALPDMLQGGWWFRPGQAAAGEEQSSPSQSRAAGQQQPTDRLTSAWWWPFGSNNNNNTNGIPGQQASSAQQRAQNGASKQCLARPRSTPANLDAAAGAQHKVRPPRVASAAKLHASAGAVQQATGSSAAIGGSPPGVAPSSAAGAAQPKRPLSSRQLRPEGQPKAAGARPSALNKQLSYQERRRHWRERQVPRLVV